MYIHLVPRVPDLRHLRRERQDRVAGHEPGRLDVVGGEELQQSVRARRRAEDAPRYVGPVGGAAVFRVDPQGWSSQFFGCSGGVG